MPPNDDVERPRASSAAERQKSIVSMTEFEGMDEYTALQKYILFYRDTRTNPHAEKPAKKKAWWQFWKSGSATAAAPIEDAGAVPDERTYSIPSPRSLSTTSIASCRRHYITASQLLSNAAFVVLIRWLADGVRAQAASWGAPSRLELALHPRWSQSGANHQGAQRPHRTAGRRAGCEMSITIHQNRVANSHCSHQHTTARRSQFPRRRKPSQALWLERDFV